VSTLEGGGRPDGKRRWRTLSHAGVGLPPPYAPHGVPVGVPGSARPVSLSGSPDAEHMLTEYVRLGGTTGRRPELLGSTAAADAFWGDWSRMLPARCPIRSLSGLDVSRLRAHLAAAKGAAAAAGTKRGPRPAGEGEGAGVGIGRAMVDGRPQPVVPAAVDRPGIFVGKGSHTHTHTDTEGAATGRIRRRIVASDVVLNLGPGAPVPRVPLAGCGRRGAGAGSGAGAGQGRGCRWGGVVRDPTVDWVAKWRDPLTSVVKYARLGPASSAEQGSARDKFEVARRVARALPAFRQRVRALMTAPASRPPAERELGALLWLVERLALRVGTTTAVGDRARGASTLLARDVVVLPRGAGVRLDFPGKDGVRYVRTLGPGGSGSDAATRDALAVLRRAAGAAAAANNAPLLPSVTARDANAAIERMLPPGASSRVLRTCAACALFERTLRELEPSGSGSGSAGTLAATRAGAALALLIAHARVAVLCNHRRDAGPSSAAAAALDGAELDARLDGLAEEARALLRQRSADAGRVRQLAARVRDRVVLAAGLSLTTARANYLDPRIAAAFMARVGLPPDGAFTPALARKYGWALRDTRTSFLFASEASHTADPALFHQGPGSKRSS
jgi:DNA topoisomerase-1